MQEELTYPNTLQEAILRFADRDYCLAVVAKLRWPNGVTCPHCKSEDEPYFLKTRCIWKCRSCGKQFSVKVGTIFEDSALGLDTWLGAIWMIANDKNGISSCEIARELGVTQKTAWFLLHRIRKVMELGSVQKLKGEVEADETLVGGKVGNMHKDRAAKAKALPNNGKTTVMGMVERNGEVRAKVVPDAKKLTLQPELKRNVKRGSALYTDQLPSYTGLSPRYGHETINHAVAYVRGNVHTNTMENFWSLFKRTMRGTYIHCEPDHLQRYVTEQAFRYNGRKGTNAQRFLTVLSQVSGKRLTYKGLAEDA